MPGNRTILIYWLAPVLLLLSCGSPVEDNETSVRESNVAVAKTGAEIPLVTLHKATTGRLPLRRQATGKLRSRREVTIKSQSGGLLLTAPVEGTFYKKGTPLLTTDPRPLELARDRAAAALDEANYRERDLLLRLSTNLAPEDSTSITDLARANVHLQAGIPAAEVALAEAEFQLSLARLPAPFGGRAADVLVQPGDQVAPGQEICTLIDPASLEAEFSLLEQEIASLAGQRSVYITPVAQPALRLRAELDIINPRVDAGGLLRVRARLIDGKKNLYPGMNVTVTLEGKAPSAVLLPKSAVVLRSGRPLVFTYDEPSGLAKWQYVTIAAENDELVAIAEGVEPGQRVVVAGGLTLDHDSPVRVE